MFFIGVNAFDRQPAVKAGVFNDALNASPRRFVHLLKRNRPNGFGSMRPAAGTGFGSALRRRSFRASHRQCHDKYSRQQSLQSQVRSLGLGRIKVTLERLHGENLF
jgi:hypothetical protein